MFNNYKYLSCEFLEKNCRKKNADTIFNILDNTIDKLKSDVALDFKLDNSQSQKSNITSILLFLGESHSVFENKKLYNELVYNYMLHAKRMIEEDFNYMSSSLYGGLTDFALAVYSITRNNKLYIKFLTTLNNEIIDRVTDKISTIENFDDGVFASDYDVINGIAGIGNYFMNYVYQDDYKNILKKILIFIINLFKSKEIENRDIPSYYIPHLKQATEIDKEIYPTGSINFSLSHGISGPLFVLLKAKKYNFLVDGLDEAIEKGVQDICKFSHKNKIGKYNFSGRVSLESYIDNKIDYINNRASWCYGNPGMVKVIYEANKEIKSQKIDNILRSSLDFIINYPNCWEINSPIICHGYGSIAVLLQSLILYDKNNNKLNKSHEDIIQTILDTYNPKSKYGFCDIKYVDSNGKQKVKNNQVNFKNIILEKEDSLCFLTGSLGILLILLNSFEIENKIWLQKLCMDRINSK